MTHSMKKHLVSTDYRGFSVTFTEDAWFNATEVAERFGKRPVDWLKLPSTDEYLQMLCEELRSEKSSLLKVKRGGRGKSDSTWMHPDLAVPFARWLDVRFSIWCDQQIKRILAGNHPHHDWKKMRHEAASSFKVMNQILQLTRERIGKTCAPHHFSNEARLINWALTGTFGKLDRDGLGPGDLDLLAKLENLDTVLIGCGSDYDTRKRELERYAAEQRAPRLTLVKSK